MGLAPAKHILGSWAHSPDKTIGLFPEWFASPQPDWPQNAKLAGFVLHSDGPGTLPPQLVDFLDAGAPPIIFTPGTEMKHAHDFFATSVQALAQLGRRGILVSRHTEHLPPSLPEGVISFPYIPFDAALPRAAAIVHHGGIGTTAQAIAAGIPQVVRPMAHDQPDNAARSASRAWSDNPAEAVHGRSAAFLSPQPAFLPERHGRLPTLPRARPPHRIPLQSCVKRLKRWPAATLPNNSMEPLSATLRALAPCSPSGALKRVEGEAP